MIVLDTSVLSLAYRPSRPPTRDDVIKTYFAKLLDEEAPLAIPGIVLQEVLSGVKGATDYRRLDDLLSGFPLLLANRGTHSRAAVLRNQCRTKGISTSTVDCLIAAHAIEAEGELLTADHDFRHIARHTDLELHPVPRR
jgi:predicted nucleic acid-binding protein